jgi:hypothetical protein
MIDCYFWDFVKASGNWYGQMSWSLRSMENNQFDTIAPSYRQSILSMDENHGRITGFYARCRIQCDQPEIESARHPSEANHGFWLRGRRRDSVPAREFGASTEIIGVDVSRNSLELAASKYASDRVTFEYLDHHSRSRTWIWSTAMAYFITSMEVNGMSRRNTFAIAFDRTVTSRSGKTIRGIR